MCEISFIYNECGIYFLKRQRGLLSCLFRKYILHELYINDISHILYVYCVYTTYPLSEFAYNTELFDTSVITTTPREQTELHVHPFQNDVIKIRRKQHDQNNNLLQFSYLQIRGGFQTENSVSGQRTIGWIDWNHQMHFTICFKGLFVVTIQNSHSYFDRKGGGVWTPYRCYIDYSNIR